MLGARDSRWFCSKSPRLDNLITAREATRLQKQARLFDPGVIGVIRSRSSRRYVSTRLVGTVAFIDDPRNLPIDFACWLPIGAAGLPAALGVTCCPLRRWEQRGPVGSVPPKDRVPNFLRRLGITKELLILGINRPLLN